MNSQRIAAKPASSVDLEKRRFIFTIGRAALGVAAVALGVEGLSACATAGNRETNTIPVRGETKVPVPASVPTPTRSQAYRYEQYELGKGKGTLNVVIFDPRRVELKVAVAVGGSTAQKMAKKPENKGAVVITNGPYFNGPRPHLYLKSAGKAVNPEIKTSDKFFPENIEAIFVINDKGGASVVPASDDSTSATVNSPATRLAIQNGPWLVRNGNDVSGRLIEKYPKSSHMGKARPRTLLGITDDGNVTLATIAKGTGVNLQKATAEMMKRYKLRELVDMDGGPETQMVVDLDAQRRVDISGSNTVPAFLVVLPK